MRRYRRLLQMIGMVCLLVSMAGCGSASPIAHQGVAAPTALPAPATPTPLVYREPFNQKVDVGGYILSIKCVGTGSPTVVLDAGLNGTGTPGSRSGRRC